MLEAAEGRLLVAILKRTPKELTQLLELSFAHAGLPQLRGIPLAILRRLPPDDSHLSSTCMQGGGV